ncbi:alcohol oxidase [Rhodotorula toruloides]|uniref:Alcohol oxidase n=1 Tax=Rhodotorula toruloides TaxID=5286 RepID=A0A511KHV5_RHOTO|nr:alcohol oxidase [Rhodotorula toruloides]
MARASPSRKPTAQADIPLVILLGRVRRQTSFAHKSRDHGNTSKEEGRPMRVDRPSWFGSSLDPAVAISAEPMEGSEFRASISSTPSTTKREPTLPPGFSREAFDRAIDDLRGAIGADFVEINDVPLNAGNYYHPSLSHDSYAVLEEDYFVPSAVAWPGSTAEVQAIVKWANRWKIPLWPISIGRNLGYGGAAPRVPGSLLIDLGRRMDKVLNIDEKAATCLLQPGVTYIELYEELKRRGLGEKLWIDVPDLGGGSVVGNALDRGVGYTPYGDHWAQHCGMEVVLANGEVVRLGMDSMPGSKTGQCFPYGYGPFLDGIFTQSNFGIVTRMGMFLMPNPGGILPFMISFMHQEDLQQAVDILQELMVSRLLGNVPSLRLGLWDAAVYGSKDHWWPENAGRPVTDEVEEEIVKKANLGYWVFYGALYGPDEVTSAQWKVVQSKFAGIRDVRFQLREDVPANSYLHDRAAVFAGVPTFRELAWHQWITNAGELFFAPISGVNGRDAVAQVAMCKKICTKHGFDYLGTFYVAQRELIRTHAELGYGEYRSHIATADDIMATYNWNDGAFRKLCEQLKDSLDPNGILQPGRSGIWPKDYRGKGWEIDGVRPLKHPKGEAGKL